MTRSPKVYNKRHRDAPDDAVYVGRPSRWGNPFTVGEDGSREQVVERYYLYLLENSKLFSQVQSKLAGKDLVCWCAPKMCHADVLLAVAAGSKWEPPQTSLL